MPNEWFSELVIRVFREGKDTPLGIQEPWFLHFCQGKHSKCTILFFCSGQLSHKHILDGGLLNQSSSS